MQVSGETWSRRGLRLPAAAALLLGAWMVLPSPAYAYVDPGSGSMFLQLLLATLLGALYALKAYWRKIRDWFTRQRQEPEPTERHD